MTGPRETLEAKLRLYGVMGNDVGECLKAADTYAAAVQQPALRAPAVDHGRRYAREVHAQFVEWFSGQGYDGDTRFDWEEMEFAFEAGTRAQDATEALARESKQRLELIMDILGEFIDPGTGNHSAHVGGARMAKWYERAGLDENPTLEAAVGAPGLACEWCTHGKSEHADGRRECHACQCTGFIPAREHPAPELGDTVECEACGLHRSPTQAERAAPGLTHTREDVIASYNAGYIAAAGKHGKPAPDLAAVTARWLDQATARDRDAGVVRSSTVRAVLLAEAALFREIDGQVREITGAHSGQAEAIAAHMDELAANYPESVFPANSDTRDGISGTAMRHAYKTAARLIRERAGVTS